MRKIKSIALRELAGYFRSPIAYIVLVITVVIFNVFFYLIIEENREATLKDVFRVMEFMFVFLVPLITMKTFAEEKASGTIEFLMTSPTTNTAIVLGKYLGSLCFFSVIILFTSIYYFILEYFTSPDRMAVLSGYIGVWLEGAFFIAIGVMASSWTRNQILAAINAYLIIFALFFSFVFIRYFSGPWEAVIRHLSTVPHLENFSIGIVTVADIVYYLSGIFLCVTITRICIENRLWR